MFCFITIFVVSLSILRCLIWKASSSSIRSAYGLITLKYRWSLKLSNIGQYLDVWPHGNTSCCKLGSRGDLMNNALELIIGELSSNSDWVHYIHSWANTLTIPPSPCSAIYLHNFLSYVALCNVCPLNISPSLIHFTQNR